MSSIETELDDIVTDEIDNLSNVFNQLALSIFSLESYDSDLYILAKILDHDNLVKVIDYFDGDTIKIPQKDEYRNAYLLAVCFFLKEKKNWSWQKIRETLKLDELNGISTISLGKKINVLREALHFDMKQLLDKIEIDIEDNILKGIKL